MNELNDALEGEALARKIADLCDEKKGFDIQILHMTPVLGMTDYFVLCSASSERQARIIAEHCDRTVKDMGGWRKPPMEGAHSGSSWICADFGDVVLHVFTETQRRHYNLDGIWGDVERVAWFAPQVPAQGQDTGAGDSQDSGSVYDSF